MFHQGLHYFFGIDFSEEIREHALPPPPQTLIVRCEESGDITLRSFQFQFLLTHRSRSNTLLLRPKLYATTPALESGAKRETLLKAQGRTRVKGQGEKEEVMIEIIEIIPKCPFSWEKLKEMRDQDIKFWAADGLNQLRIVGIDEKQKSFYMINQSGKITWPLRYEKLEEVHDRIHNGRLTLLSYEIDRLIPTWGNYISGLFKYFGCDKG